MKKHVVRAIHGNIIFVFISNNIFKIKMILFFNIFLGAQWASRDAKLEAEKKIDRLHGSFVGTDIFFNFTFLQERYGKVRKLNNFICPAMIVF